MINIITTLILLLCFNLSAYNYNLLQTKHNDLFSAICNHHGLDKDEVSKALKLFYNHEWLDKFYYFCNHNIETKNILRELYSSLSNQKLILESIRPRPAKDLIIIDKKLLGLNLLLQLVNYNADIDNDIYADEDD